MLVCSTSAIGRSIEYRYMLHTADRMSNSTWSRIVFSYTYDRTDNNLFQINRLKVLLSIYNIITIILYGVL